MLKNNKVLLASSNQGKIREFKKIFKGIDFISQEDLGIDDAVEDGHGGRGGSINGGTADQFSAVKPAK